MLHACDAGCDWSVDAPLTSSSGAEHEFDFDSLVQINSRGAFFERLPLMSKSSKNFFALSSQYFDTKTLGTVQVIGDLTSFTQSEELGGFELSIQTPSFTFTCWVKTTKTFASGYLIRKRPFQTSELSCWGWYLDSRCFVSVCIHLRLCACVRHFGSRDHSLPQSSVDMRCLSSPSVGRTGAAAGR